MEDRLTVLLGIEMMGRGRREEVLCRHSAATWTREPCDHRHLPDQAKGRLCGERLLTRLASSPPPRHVLLTFLYPACPIDLVALLAVHNDTCSAIVTQ